MPFNQTDLQQTFLQARDLFNAGDYESMRPLLHPNIVWKKLHHGDSEFSSDSVIAWLKSQKAALVPQFLPDPAKAVTPSANTGDGSRKIRGPAQWQAQKGGVNEDIEYIFTFTTDRDGRWLLINAFGHVLS